jgi:hypothetical protein
MLFLAESLLTAAGFNYNDTEGTWVAPLRLPPVVTVECGEDVAYITEALLEVHAVLEACGCTYTNFAIRDGYLSLVGLTAARLAAVA